MAARSLSPSYARATPAAGSTRVVAPVTTAAAPLKASYSRADILAALKTEIASRNVAWLEPDVQLVPPDRIVVSGKVKGPAGPTPAQATLQVGVTDTGAPRVFGQTLNAGAEQLRAALETALTRRVGEANLALAGQLPAGQRLRRIYVKDAETLVAQLTGGATVDAGTDGPPWPTPTTRPAQPPDTGSRIIPHALPPATHDHSSLVGGFLRPDSVTPVPPERRLLPALPAEGSPASTTPAGASP